MDRFFSTLSPRYQQVYILVTEHFIIWLAKKKANGI